MSLIDSIKELINNFKNQSIYKINRMRPPGSINEELFVKLCIRCSRCIEACPFYTIKRSSTLTNGNIGTPYIYAEEKGCHLCMNCTEVCPTGAINAKLTYYKDVRIGIAKVDENICLNHIYSRYENSDTFDGTASLCSQCFNVCPLKFDAIYLKDQIIPTITDQCTGCGMCTATCPTKPNKAINIIPKDMPDDSEAGYHQYLKRIGR